MNSNNKKRLLYLLETLIKYTDENHHLSLNELISHLEEHDIVISDRKTIYDDLKTLNDFGYEVEYINKKYYLSEAPFSLSEIKILIDSTNSLKSLDSNFANKLKEKLYSFTSINNEKLLKKLEYTNLHRDSSFINRLEDTLSAIQSNTMIKIQRIGKDKEEISPLFLHRNNDFYYLYYTYKNNSNIYHVRFDNIKNIEFSDSHNDVTIPINKIHTIINESTNSFHSKNSQYIEFEILKDSEYLKERLKDDFNNIIFTKKGFSIKTSISDVFFSKLVSYGTQIKITNQKICSDYVTFLNNIIKTNTKQ